MQAKNSPASELDILRRIRTRAAQPPHGGLRLGIGDDCALLRIGPGEDLAVTTDLAIDGRHFRRAWHPPETIGHRTLARGLSDLAAMGARPIAAFLSFGLPRDLARGQWVERFLDGFLALARAHNVPLAGGDLAESPLAVADIVLTGAVRRGRALLRSGARAGDELYVTGKLGGAAAGLDQLAAWAEGGARRLQRGAPRLPEKLRTQLAAHLAPEPRLAQGQWLARHGVATAAIDLSDGLSTDLAHLCGESRVAAAVDAAALPIGPGANLAQALHGGEDYELLFTASAAARVPRRIAGVAVTRIGRIVRPRKGRPQVTLIGAEGAEPLAAQGWEHFG